MKSPLVLTCALIAASVFFARPALASEAATSGRPVQSFRFTMWNDNPFLNLIPPLGREDDFGPTQGTGVEHAIVRPAGFVRANERWSVQLHSDLYTRNRTPAGQDLFPRIPQVFNELSTLNVIWDDLFAAAGTKNFYHVFELGLGLVNDSRPNGVLAIGQQTAWHHFKHYRLTPDKTALYANQPGTTHDLFGTARIGAGRVFLLGNDHPYGRESNLLKVEGGAEWLGIRRGSSVYFLASGNRSLGRSGRTGLGIDAGLRGNLAQTGDANVRSSLGIVIDRPTFTIQTGMSYVLGAQNQRLLKYVDRDPIWNLVIEKRWGGAGTSASHASIQ